MENNEMINNTIETATEAVADVATETVAEDLVPATTNAISDAAAQAVGKKKLGTGAKAGIIGGAIAVVAGAVTTAQIIDSKKEKPLFPWNKARKARKDLEAQNALLTAKVEELTKIISTSVENDLVTKSETEEVEETK